MHLCHMRHIPFLLIVYRVLAAVGILVLSTFNSEAITVIVFLILTGLISDIFDGIIARKLNVATERLRRMDSMVDQFFWVAIGAALLLLRIDFIKTHWLGFVSILVAEITIYLVAYFKFKKEVATHSWGAKAWTLSMLAFVIELLISGDATYTYYIWIWLGLVSRSEIIAIFIYLNHWQADVPTLWHAVHLAKKTKENKSKNAEIQ